MLLFYMKCICNYCCKEFKKAGSSTIGKYCSNECSQFGRREAEYERFINGEVVGRGYIRAHIVRLYGWKCMVCDLTEWMGQPIPLEVDHIDGNAGNNFPANLRNICPNCHAQTPTHKAKNKGNGRGSRGLPWY